MSSESTLSTGRVLRCLAAARTSTLPGCIYSMYLEKLLPKITHSSTGALQTLLM